MAQSSPMPAITALAGGCCLRMRAMSAFSLRGKQDQYIRSLSPHGREERTPGRRNARNYTQVIPLTYEPGHAFSNGPWSLTGIKALCYRSGAVSEHLWPTQGLCMRQTRWELLARPGSGREALMHLPANRESAAGSGVGVYCTANLPP